MRFSHSLLLASVAILALPSCSSAKGPGEIGSRNDIVVRNFGDAPPPPSENMLMQEPATPPEMMAARTLQGDVPEIDDSEARALAAQHEAEVAQQAPQADAVQAQMQAAQQAEIAAQRQVQAQTPTEQYAQEVQQGFQQQAEANVPRAPEPTQMQRQALEAQQQAVQQGGMEAVPAPVVNAAPTLPEQATQTMPVQDRVEAAIDSTRANVTAQGEATAQVLSQPVAQAATEYQAQPVDQAAQQALQNPPVSTVNVLQEQQVNPQAHQAAQAAAPAPQAVAQAVPVAVSGVPTTTSRVPTPEEIAAGGVRVVITEQGTPVIGQQLVPPAPAAEAVPAPVAPVPVSTPAAAIALGDASMLSRAQTVLTQKGFYNGPADGKMSTELMNALSRYQSANFLTPGLLNEETARHMGLIQ